MVFLWKKKVLLAKLESVYGTDPTPTPAANAIEARDIQHSAPVDQEELDTFQADLSPSGFVSGKRMQEIKFTVDLKGSGTKGTAPRIGALFQACGFAETVSAGSSVIYTPASLSDGCSAVTVYYYKLGDASSILEKLTGCRGTITNLVMEAGKVARIEFLMRGLVNDPVDIANPSGMSFETTKPPIVQSSGLSFGGTQLSARGLTFALNNSLADEESANAAGGVAAVHISGRKPSGTYTPSMVALGTKNFRSLLVAGTESAVSITVGSADGNIIEVTMPKAQIESISEEQQNGLGYLNIPLRFNRNTGNDEVQFKFR
jgi:hypothetical protein